MQPKISVIVPIYNVEDYLRQCLNSIINQTLKDIEIILVDDGSTDSSGDICDEYKLKDSRIKVIHQKNQYVGVARNSGISIATGDYVICLDSDDTFDKNMLETMYNKAIETNAQITICHEKSYNTKTNAGSSIKWASYCTNKYKNNEVFSAKDLSKYIFNFCILWPWDKLYKRQFLVSNNLTYLTDRIIEASEDLLLVGQSLAIAEKIVVLPNEFVTHKYHKASLEANRNIYASTVALKNLETFLKEKKLYETFEQSFINLVKMYYSWDLSVATKSKKKMLSKEIEKGLKYFKINQYKKDYFYETSIYNKHKFIEFINKLDLLIKIF